MLLNRLLDILPPTPTPTPPNPSWEFLNSQFFNTFVVIIFGLVALIALIVAIKSYRQGQRRKELAWQVRSDSLVIPNQEVRDRIEIHLDGKPIQDLSLVSIQVWNSGNIAIASIDYVHPIKLKFEGRTVQDAYISDMEPRTLQSQEEVEKYRRENEILRQKEPALVKLPELHFNSQKASGILNSYTLKVLLTGPKGEISVVEGMINEGYLKEVPLLVGSSVESAAERAALIAAASALIAAIIGAIIGAIFLLVQRH